MEPNQRVENQLEQTNINRSATVFAKTYFHGTKADLKLGDLIKVGFLSNYEQNQKSQYIYLTETLDAAIWGAELSVGEGRERIYLVEPTGEIENDPDLTDKKIPGNPTKSYRSIHPFRVIGEVTIWQSHTHEQVSGMKEAISLMKNHS
ncbi:MAG: rifampin ADP-ribosyl transferase [Bacteroidetes bacterium]|nr:rifampin ADP-ribosyl transferase [Bacteroidota bacterium]